jgi:transcriptional regulator with XRE-family HTH domain
VNGSAICTAKLASGFADPFTHLSNTVRQRLCRRDDEVTSLVPAKQREEFRRMLRQGRQQRRLSQRNVADAIGVSHTAVSQWESGRSLPIPAKVPDLERALELEPGALSRLLGYLPIASGDDKTSLDVIEAIRRDARLGKHGQELLITMYRQLLRQHGQAVQPS